MCVPLPRARVRGYEGGRVRGAGGGFILVVVGAVVFGGGWGVLDMVGNKIGGRWRIWYIDQVCMVCLVCLT